MIGEFAVSFGSRVQPALLECVGGPCESLQRRGSGLAFLEDGHSTIPDRRVYPILLPGRKLRQGKE